MKLNRSKQQYFWSRVKLPNEIKDELIRKIHINNIIPLLLQFIIKNKEYNYLKTQCWIWEGGIDKNNYGKVFESGAHRYSWLSSRLRDIKQKYLIRHTCDNPICVNPFHLRQGTPAQNLRDMVERGRSLKGEKHPDAVLTDNDVRDILTSLHNGITITVLAKKYKVSEASISPIFKRKTWTHITKEFDDNFLNDIILNTKKNQLRNKLSIEQVLEIKDLFFNKRYTKAEISRKFQIGPTTVTNILDGSSWKNV